MENMPRGAMSILVGCLIFVGCKQPSVSQDKQAPTELSPAEAVAIMKEFGTREVLVPTMAGKPLATGSAVRAAIVQNAILGIESRPGITWEAEIGEDLVPDTVRAEECYDTNPERIGDWYVFGYRCVYGLRDSRVMGIWVNALTGQACFYKQIQDPPPKQDGHYGRLLRPKTRASDYVPAS